MVSSRRRESLAGRIDLLIQAMDRLGVRLERASRGPSLATGPAKRMMAASENEMHTDIAASTYEPTAPTVRAHRCLDQTTFTPNPTDATVLTVVNGAAFDPGDLIRTNYGQEIMRVRQISGNVLTVDRGFGGTPRVQLMAMAELVVMGNTTAEASVNKNAILNTVAADSSQTATVPAWKAKCHVEDDGNGWRRILSPTRSHWYGSAADSWWPCTDGNKGFVYRGCNAINVFAACTVVPPDWTEPAGPTPQELAEASNIVAAICQDPLGTYSPVDITAPEDVIDPSHAAPGRVWYGGPTTEDVQEHRLCVIPPERSSYIRPTGTPGKYDQVWHDGSVTPSAFSDGGLNQCLKSPGWSMAYEPTARVAIGLPALSELDHCREGGASC